jgi:hypothetical protein
MSRLWILEELDVLDACIEEREAVINAIDAQIASLEKERKVNLQYVRSHRALVSHVRRLPDDILLVIFFGSLALAKPWAQRHPIVIASQVCRQWRDLSLSTLFYGPKLKYIYLGPVWRNNIVTVNCKKHTVGTTWKLTSSNTSHFFIPMTMSWRGECGRSSRGSAGVHSSLSLPEGISRQPQSCHFPGRTYIRCLHILVGSWGLGMQSATLSIRTHSPDLPVPDLLWNRLLLEGEFDLRYAKLYGLSALMSYIASCRLKLSESFD